MKYLASVIVLTVLVLPRLAFAEEIVDIAFPVEGSVSFSNDYDGARSGGRIHHAIDILAEKMTPIVAPVDGVISYAPMTEPSYGYMLSLRGDDGYGFNFIHINNDTPGTDDGLGGVEHAYAPGIENGTRVERGELIAWVGDSGNAESTAPHLHFEMEDQDGVIMNPYASLIAAYSAVSFDPDLESELATSINVDQDIQLATGEVSCTSDSLVRTPEVSTVYYCGQDGGRYVFQNESTFFSWYDNFDDVEFISTETMASLPLRGVVTYKPGSYMVKLLSVPKVYAVSRNGTLRWVVSSELASSLYGSNWASFVRDVPDGFFPSYSIGEDITGG
ncbi:MAG: M23 family metallopeptidase [Candidatus Uhrbacteria bacterium]|nr:M23 family metallopeptidase [Candidatus Uhrbacteria bacterium]